MREIKFRAWVKRENLFYDFLLRDQPDAKGFMFIGFSFADIWAGHDEANTSCENGEWAQPVWDKAILMQYTGLKDKNGKEIYEGDILETKNGKWWFRTLVCFGDFEIDLDYALLKITGWYSKRVANHLNEFIGDDEPGIDTKGSVIGNLFETPDLIWEE